MPLAVDIVQTRRLVLQKHPETVETSASINPDQDWIITSKINQNQLGTLHLSATQAWLEIGQKHRRQGLGREALTAMTAQLDNPECLRVKAPLFAAAFLAQCGFARANDFGEFSGPDKQQAMVRWNVQRDRKHEQYPSELAALHLRLDLPPDYGEAHQLEPVHEATALKCIGKDIFNRPQHLTLAAAAAWQNLCLAAHMDEQVVNAVSAYRSVKYQTGIVQRKLGAGQPISEILRVSAAPGYSEHHSGNAIDVTDDGSEPLSDEFDQTETFAWLEDNAQRFGFRLSFPRDNVHNLAYEPWHWCFNAEAL